MNTNFVAILMGSASDLPTMQSTIEVLQKFRIPFEIKVASAHRTPYMTKEYIHDAESRGCAIFIAAAGLAAHLAGTIAAHTCKPVIGVPMDAGSLNGLDALLSTVQMPGGIPVACVAIGKPGAKNAGYLAAQMLAITDAKLAKLLSEEREANAQIIEQQNETLLKTLSMAEV